MRPSPKTVSLVSHCLLSLGSKIFTLDYIIFPVFAMDTQALSEDIVMRADVDISVPWKLV